MLCIAVAHWIHRVLVVLAVVAVAVVVAAAAVTDGRMMIQIWRCSDSDPGCLFGRGFEHATGSQHHQNIRPRGIVSNLR